MRLTTTNIDEVTESVKPPSDPFEAVDKLLWYVHTKMKKFSDSVQLDKRVDYPVIVARDSDEFSYVLRKARELQYLKASTDQGLGHKLTLEGWKYLESIRNTRTRSNQAFVAMSFAADLKSLWKVGIEPALRATGFNPIRLDDIEHNEKIDDRIIADIRRSGLVVVDCTGAGANVYFEAGFALGLNIPVIWMCHDEHPKDVHFDTRQYNYITWRTPEEAGERLRLRIEATIPGRARLLDTQG